MDGLFQPKVVSRSLTFRSITRSDEATALLDALRDNKWPKLEKLNVNSSHLPEGFVSNLANIVQGGACSSVTKIEVFCDSRERGLELGQVLLEGACPKLEMLCLALKESGASSARYIDGLKSRLSGRGITLARDW